MSKEIFFAPAGLETGHQLVDEPFGFERYEAIPEKYVRQLYRNPKVSSEIDFRDYAVFVDRFKRGQDQEKNSDAFILPHHHRAVNYVPAENLVEKITLTDGSVEEAHYTTVNTKGGGLVLPELYEGTEDELYAADNPEVMKHSSDDYSWGYDMLGLMDGRVAAALQANTEKVLAEGGRAESVAAIYAIDAVKFKGKWTAIDELRKMKHDDGTMVWPRANFEEIRMVNRSNKKKEDKKFLQELTPEGRYIGEYHPAIVVRLQRSPYRIKDFDQESNPVARRKILDHALNVISWEQKQKDPSFPELSADNKQDIKKYLELMSGWIGQNLAVIENIGSFMKFFNSGNVSMVGELIDLDSIVSAIKTKKDGSVVASGEGTYHYEGDQEDYDIPRFVYKDIRDSILALYKIYTAIKEIVPELSLGKGTKNSMVKEFLQSYEEKLDSQKGLSLLVGKEKLLEIASGLLEKRFVQNEKLPRTSLDEE